ncbi:MAG: cytidylate kinase family protein [Betaproteobacteria bacterium]|nr:cytidylate kinase family protein [Betaproteobacteria bacterium]
MPLIAMNREMGSLGKDVAKGLEEALGLKIRHHEIIDQLANRARMRKSHVVSFLEGTQGLFERLTVDQISLRILTADEILSVAASSEGLILRGWGATSLLKDVPHAVRVCITASRKVRVRRMMERLESQDAAQIERIVDQNDEAARAVMRRHFHIDTRDITEYDLGFNTDRISVAQCVEEIINLVKSEQFAETDQSRARLQDAAVAQHVRAALRTHASTSHCSVRVSAQAGRVTLEGVVDGEEQRRACAEIASRIKGATVLENLLRVAEVPARLRGDS